jgi:hypothetical protein
MTDGPVLSLVDPDAAPPETPAPLPFGRSKVGIRPITHHVVTLEITDEEAEALLHVMAQFDIAVGDPDPALVLHRLRVDLHDAVLSCRATS